MMKSKATREVAWGDALVVEVFHVQGGLKAVVDAIVAEVGPMVGTRNTFAKLLHVSDPSGLGAKDLWRAWLLLAALHHNPDDWGVSSDNAPASVDTEALRARLEARVRHQGLEPRTRWFSGSGHGLITPVEQLRPAA